MQISFINELEARNMRHDVMAKNQEWEQRAQLLAEERARKVEEKAAKEAAAEERRRNADTVCLQEYFFRRYYIFYQPVFHRKGLKGSEKKQIKSWQDMRKLRCRK